MRQLYKTMMATAILAGSCLATHQYKGTPLSDELFDSSMDCGLNLEKINECVKEDRTAGKGDSFCNSVLLFAGNKQKMIDADAAMKQNPATAKMQLEIMKGLNELQKKFSHDFIDAGLQPEEIGHIPPIKRGDIGSFKCKKVERSKKVHIAEQQD